MEDLCLRRKWSELEIPKDVSQVCSFDLKGFEHKMIHCATFFCLADVLFLLFFVSYFYIVSPLWKNYIVPSQGYYVLSSLSS